MTDPKPLANQHIAVLLGGPSAEREVSLATGAACADALERLGARVTRVDPGPDIAPVLVALKPDAVFNGLHGRWGEDGCVQGVLETPWAWPTPTPASWPRPWPWTRPRARRCWRRRASRCPAAASTIVMTWRADTS